MSGLINDISQSFTAIANTETATGLVNLAGSLVGIGGMPTTNQYEGLLDAAPDWMWTADIVNVPGLIELSNIYIRDITFSMNHINTHQVFRNGIYQSFPKFVNPIPTQILFYEPYNYSISYYLESWRNKIWVSRGNNGFGVWQEPSKYMGSIIIRLYDYTGLLQMSVQLDGVWPTSQQNFNLQYASSNMTGVACEFSINQATITYIGTGFNSLLGTSNLTTDLLSVGTALAAQLSNGIVQLI